MLLKISRIFVYVSVFSVLVVMTSTFFPFIGGKDYFFRFSVELSLLFFVLWWAIESGAGDVKARFRDISKKPVFIAVTLFVLAFMLATIFAYDPSAAFWSNYERGEGGFQLLHYYALFVILVMLFDREDDWRRLFKASAIAAALMILYGIFANLGWADNFISPYQGAAPPSGWWQKLIKTRFQGSLGNPAYVAPYLVFSMFYTVYLWITSPSRKKRLVSAGYALLMIFYFFFLLISQTRGALLGLAASIFVFLLWLVIATPSSRKYLVTALFAFVIVFGTLVYFGNSEFVKKIPGGRIFSISFSEQTVNTRLWTWGSAWHAFEDRPILGWGPENFSAAFDKYFDPRHYVPGQDTETWFDRAHNLLFDYLAETGVVGALSYLSIFVVLLLGLFKNAWRERTNDQSLTHKSVQALMFSLPIGYLVQGVAIFEVLPMYLNVFLFWAFGFYYLYGRLTQKNG